MTYELHRTYYLYLIAYPQNLQFNNSSVTTIEFLVVNPILSDLAILYRLG